MSVPRARSAAIALASASLLLAATGVVLGGGGLGGLNGRDPSSAIADAFQLVTLAATVLVGLMVSLGRPRNPIGWIFSAPALMTGLRLLAGGYAIHALILTPGSLPGGVWAAWLRNWADRPTVALALDAVRANLLAAVDETVQPTHASVWLREPGS